MNKEFVLHSFSRLSILSTHYGIMSFFPKKQMKCVFRIVISYNKNNFFKNISAVLQFFNVTKVFHIMENCACVPFWLNKLLYSNSECGSGLIRSIQYHIERILFISLLNYYHYFQLSIHSIEAFIVCNVSLFTTQKKKNWLNTQYRLCFIETERETRYVV